MNSIYRSIWNDKTGTYVATSEIAKSHGKKTSSGATALPHHGFFSLKGLAVSLMLAFGANVSVYALPTGGAVTAGSATIATAGSGMTINQTSQNAALNWQSFNIGSAEAVRFVQPSSSSVALNRVLGADPSSIFGSLSANGKVFLVNPNGMLFGTGASVNVGGLVASTLNITDGDFMAGSYKFSGASNAAILNQGSINADGGYVALLGANISNQGVIAARLGSVALAAGNAVTLDIAGDGLLNVTVNQGAVNALVQNGGLIQADGGQVLLTAQAAGSLLPSAVNNTGVIQAQTIANHNGSIKLMGDMQSGTVNVDGRLDASAPNGGDGGFVETSAAQVNVADSVRVTSQSAQGKSGAWLIDPADFTIAASGGNISGTTLGTNLAGGPVTILSSSGTAGGSGDINVNAAVSWSANLLTLTAARDININAVMTASGTSTLAMNTATANGADAAVAGGAVKVGMNGDGFIGRVDFPSRNGAGILTVNGLAYTIVDVLGASGTSTVTDLQGMKSGLATNYALGANIADAGLTSGWNAGAGFVPVGTTGTPFTGKFDGLGHTITGLTINSGAADAGLFGASAPTSSFSNVGLVGGSVVGAAGSGGLVGVNAAGSKITNSYNTGSVSGAVGSGGLVGVNGAGSAISNSFTTGNVSGAASTGGLVGSNLDGSAISNSYANGTVTGSGAGTGGLAGTNTTGAVSKSYASGNVTGAGASTGGLLGSTTTGPVSDTYATGAVTGGGADVGGLIGTSGGTVTTSYAVGAVGGGGTNKGALVGVGGAGTVTFSFWNSDTSVAPGSVVGGLGMTTAQMKAQADFTSATAANGNVNPNWDFANTWVMYEGLTYPLLRPFMTPLTVTANNASTTYNAAAQTGGGGVTYSPSSYNGTYVLGAVNTSGGGTAVGSYAITPSGLYSNQKGYIISYANGTLNINAAGLTVTADNQARLYGAANPALTTTVSGFVGGENSSVLSGAGSATTTAGASTGVGTAVITAGVGSLSASNYVFSTFVNGTLTISSVPLTITAANATKTYGQIPTLSAFTAVGLVNGETVGSVTETSPGTAAAASVAGSPYAITPSAATGGSFSPANYSISYVDGSLGVLAAPLGIAANGATRIYGDANPAFSATYTGFQNGETATALTGALALTTPAVPTSAVGNYAITPSGQSSSNYTITYVNGNLGVTRAALGIAANSSSKIFGSTVTFAGSEFTSTGLKNGETVGNVSLASAGAAATATVLGSPYAITASAASGGSFNASNYTISYVDGSLGVIAGGLAITANPAIKTYDGLGYTGGNGVVYTGFQGADTVASLTGTIGYGGSSQGATNVGNYAIIPSGQSSPNYTITYVNSILGVIPAPLGIAANSGSKTYGSVANFTGSEFISNGLQNGETVGSVSLTSAGSAAIANVATYAITPSNASGGTFTPANYSISYVDGTLGVIPAPLGIAANSATRLYGAANPAFSATYSNFQNGDTPASLTGTLALDTSAVATSDVGRYAITPSGQSSANYTISYFVGPLSVTPAPLNVTATDVAKSYGQTPTLTAFTTAGLLNGETVGSVTETSPGTPATASVAGSPYAITPSNATGGTFKPANYAINYINGVLTVTPISMIVTATDVAKAYGQTPTLTAFTTAGLVNGETVGSVTETSPGTPATASVAGSPYVITPSNATGGTFVPGNYTISYVNGLLTVAPVPLTVTASDVAKAYGQTPTLTAFTTAGLLNGETVGSVTETSPGTPATASVAGSPYAITPSNATGGTFTPGNYTIAYVNGLLTVTPVPLTVTAGNVSKSYGQVPTLTAFTAAGLLNGETVGSVTETSPGTPATASVAGSPYAITPSNATGGTFTPGNYTIAYINGVLTVIPVGLTVTADDALKIFGQTPVLTGFTTTGLLNGETVGSVTETSPGTAADASVVGSPYPITPSNATGGTFTPANYAITYTDGELTVMPLIQTVPVTVPSLPPLVAPPWQPAVIMAPPPAQLLNLAVAPVPVPVAAPAVVPEPAPIVAPAPEAPKLYVAPLRLRKPDRN